MTPEHARPNTIYIRLSHNCNNRTVQRALTVSRGLCLFTTPQALATVARSVGNLLLRAAPDDSESLSHELQVPMEGVANAFGIEFDRLACVARIPTYSGVLAMIRTRSILHRGASAPLG